MVVLFQEDTPLNLIAALKPDILVKGADYTLSQVVGREIVEAYGGRVELVEVLQGYSTTQISKKVQQQAGRTREPAGNDLKSGVSNPGLPSAV
jgi:D-beta-D-heptose 7-phosphate kinase / D-beta-D-heptose 1-phosphate adenosyltransferase